MSMLRIFVLTCASLTLLACETPTSPPSQLLTVSSDGIAITLTNSNSWPVFYMTMNPFWTARAGDFTLCTDPPVCARVPAKSTVRVPYTEIAGYHAGELGFQLTQWRIRLSSSGHYEATDVQSFEASLQP